MTQTEIGVNAGILWKLLADKGLLSLREIGENTSLNVLSIGMALGWLSRENKLNFIEKNGTTYFELLSAPANIYY